MNNEITDLKEFLFSPTYKYVTYFCLILLIANLSFHIDFYIFTYLVWDNLFQISFEDSKSIIKLLLIGFYIMSSLSYVVGIYGISISAVYLKDFVNDLFNPKKNKDNNYQDIINKYKLQEIEVGFDVNSDRCISIENMLERILM